MSIQITVCSLDIGGTVTPILKSYDKDVITFGKQSNNDVILNSPEISDLHARLTVRRGTSGAALYLTDLGSNTGTLVENRPLRANLEVEVSDRDRIVIGKYLIRPTVMDVATNYRSAEQETINGRPNGRESYQPNLGSGESSTSHVINSTSEAGNKIDSISADSNRDSWWTKIFTSTNSQTSQYAEAPTHSGNGTKSNGNGSAHKELKDFSIQEQNFGKALSREGNTFSSPDPKFQQQDEPPSISSAEATVSIRNQFVSERPSMSNTSSTAFSQPNVAGEQNLNYANSTSNLTTTIDMQTSSQTSVVEVTKPTSITSVLVQGDDVVDLHFDATQLFAIAGTVTHKALPLAGVSIDGGTLGKTVTDGSGRFAFNNVPEGTRYSLKAERSKFEFEFPNSTGEVTGDMSLTVPATETFNIAGVVMHNGKPLKDVEVDAGKLGTTKTDASGQFFFPNVAEFTRYHLSLRKDKFVLNPVQSSGQVGAADVSLQFNAKELFTIRGRVIHKGQPMSGVEVDGGILGKTVTGPGGEYSFIDVPEGTEYKIALSKSKFIFSANRTA